MGSDQTFQRFALLGQNGDRVGGLRRIGLASSNISTSTLARYDHRTEIFPGATPFAVTTSTNFQYHTFRLGLNYHFSSPVAGGYCDWQALYDSPRRANRKVM
jgi:hypothetical protein